MGELNMENKITENTTIFEAIQINRKAGEILMSFGMHCLGCAIAHGETIGEAADVHGADLQEILRQLNDIE
jgi:hybrid cluster-associated redox disulfide protein